MNTKEITAGRAMAFDGKIEKGLAGKQGSFKPSAPANLIRPKPVSVPPKAK
jgi:hypothetical protein